MQHESPHAPTTVLEVLRAARESLGSALPFELGWRAPDPARHYHFTYWPSCTCGHVYRAATGRSARSNREVNRADPDSLYVAALRSIVDASPAESLRCARAHASDADPSLTTEAVLASCLTKAVAGVASDRAPTADLHAAARVLVDRAIEREERLDEQARLAVVAEAERVVARAGREAVVA